MPNQLNMCPVLSGAAKVLSLLPAKNCVFNIINNNIIYTIRDFKLFILLFFIKESDQKILVVKLSGILDAIIVYEPEQVA